MSRRGDVPRVSASKHAAAGRGKGSVGRGSLEGSKRSFCECFLERHAGLPVALLMFQPTCPRVVWYSLAHYCMMCTCAASGAPVGSQRRPLHS